MPPDPPPSLRCALIRNTGKLLIYSTSDWSDISHPTPLRLEAYCIVATFLQLKIGGSISWLLKSRAKNFIATTFQSVASEYAQNHPQKTDF